MNDMVTDPPHTRPATGECTMDATRTHTGWQVAAEGFVLFAMAVAPIASLAQAIGVVSGDPVEIQVAVDAATGRGLEVAGMAVTSATLEVVPSAGQAWVLAANTLVAGLFVAAVAWLVYRVLVDARTAPGPFRRGMAARLFRIAAVVLVGGLAVGMLDNLPNLLLTPIDLGMEAHLSFVPVVVAAIVGWLAEVFRRGEAMDDDLQGLV